MNQVTINENRCKGCGLCIDTCPKQVLAFAKNRLNQKGYRPSEVIAIERCIACGMCGIICPDAAISVKKDSENPRKEQTAARSQEDEKGEK